jgi:hypothetical protein
VDSFCSVRVVTRRCFDDVLTKRKWASTNDNYCLYLLLYYCRLQTVLTHVLRMLIELAADSVNLRYVVSVL